MKPLKRKEIKKAKAAAIPDGVIKVFNELLKKNWDGHSAVIKQDEVVKLIVSEMGLDNSNPLFDNHWLDVEDLYRENGWAVNYDKPAYNENYTAFWTFS